MSFGPWTQHDGTGCPLPMGTLVRVEAECWPGCLVQAENTIKPEGLCAWDWSNWCKRHPTDPSLFCARILRYQVYRSGAAEDLIRLASAPVQLPPSPYEVEHERTNLPAKLVVSVP